MRHFNFILESYLLRLPRDLRNPFIKIRTCYHRLPIETGRWSNIDRNLRICTMCNRKCIGEEYHYIMECTYYANEKKILLPCRFKKKNAFNFNELMNSGNIETLKSLSRLLRKS